jgi:hypothetical protein
MKNELEGILDSCLNDLKRGASTLDECLARHPEHAAQLKPLLQTAARVERGGRSQGPSAGFKARTRARLIQHMEAHPRRIIRGSLSMFHKFALSFTAMACAFLIAGTAYAQNVLPGNSFYTWKLASERVWRAVSTDPVSTDIRVFNRRTQEWIAVANDPTQSNKALERYHLAEDTLKSSVNETTESRILPLLESNQKLLEESGIIVSPLNLESVPHNGEGVKEGAATPLPVP